MKHGAHTRPSFPKMLTAPAAFSLLGAPLAPGDEPNPTERGKNLGVRPPVAEGNLQVPRHTQPDPCRSKHDRPKCDLKTEEVQYWDTAVFDDRHSIGILVPESVISHSNKVLEESMMYVSVSQQIYIELIWQIISGPPYIWS